MKTLYHYFLIKRSGLFDEAYYLHNYPDVRKADIDPIWHFVRIGWKEGRNPSNNFNTLIYLTLNTDVIGINPLIHYIKHGKQESRQISFDENDLDRAQTSEFKLMYKEGFFGPILHQPLVSIISINHNGEMDLNDFFESLLKQTYKDFELIIVDNNSKDRSLEIINSYSEKFNKLLLLESKTNLGFAGGNNYAYDHSSGELIALLNIDTKVDPDWLLECVDAMRVDETVASVSPKVLFWKKFQDLTIKADAPFSINLSLLVESLNYKKFFVRKGRKSGKTISSDNNKIVLSLPIPEKPVFALKHDTISIEVQFISGIKKKETINECNIKNQECITINFSPETVTDEEHIINNAGSGSRSDMPFDRGFGEYDFGQYDTKNYMPFFCGVSVLIRRSALIGRKLFVPEMFAYYEDSELSRWFRNQGYYSLYTPKPIVYHKHSSTSIEGSPEWNFLVERSRAIFSITKLDLLIKKITEIMDNYQSRINDTLFGTIEDYNKSLIDRLHRNEPIYIKENAIGIYNAFWNTFGGGESHALSIASILRDFGKVYLISEVDFNIEKLSKYFDINLDSCVKLVCHKLDEEITKKFDLFVNSTCFSNLNSQAKNSWYIVSFPQRQINEALLRNYLFLYNSDFTAKWAKKFWGKHTGISVYPTGMLKTNKNKVFNKEKYILSVGRFFNEGHSKKQLEIACAYKEMITANPELQDWKLILIGSLDVTNTSHKNYYNAIKDELLGFNYELIPNADKNILDDFYMKSYTYVHAAGLGESINLPENHEHFGITPLEAMTFGCIPIVYHVGGPADLIRKFQVGHTYATINELQEKIKLVCLGYKSNSSEVETVAKISNEFILSHRIDKVLPIHDLAI